MKFLIVDSNMNSSRNLAAIIEETVHELEYIDTANTYNMAINLFEKNRYDLVFIALQFRGGDRITLIHGLQKNYSSVHIIVYGEEYTAEDYQELIQLQVLDLLEVPFQKEKIDRCFARFFEERTKQRMKLISDRENLAQQANELIEFSFIYSVLFNGDLNWEWKRYQYLLNISGSGYVIYVSLDKNQEEKSLPYERYAKLIKKGVTAGYKSIIGKEATSRIVIFVMAKYGLERDRNTTRTEKIRYGKYIQRVFKDMFGLDAKIGIGGEKSIEKLPISYEEALRNVRFDNASMNSKHVMVCEEDGFYSQLEQKFLTDIREGSQESMNSFSSLLDLMKNYNLTDKKNKILELLVMASHIARYDGKNESEYTNYMELSNQLYHMGEENMNAWALRNVSYILKSIRDYQGANSYGDIRKVLRYVDTHYDEDITLEEAAGIMSLSPQYFSRIFKEQSGSTFVDYLTNVRMKKAKEWLVYSSDTVQEICFKVGYKDPNYFARVFKKTVGITPKQYKAQKIK